MNPDELNEDVKSAFIHYPKLVLFSDSDGFFIVGDIDVIDPETQKLIETYSVNITIPDSYPFRFPKVMETSNKIEKIVDRHVYSNGGHLCLAVPPEEEILCRDGITMKWFLDKVLVPRLAEEYGVNNGDGYNREYDHGTKGIWEFCEKWLNIKDKKVILKVIQFLFRGTLPRPSTECICGSNKPYRRCHEKNVQKLTSLSKWMLFNMEIRLSYDLSNNTEARK